MDHVFSLCLLPFGYPATASWNCILSVSRIYSLMFLIERVVDEIQVWKFFVTFGDVLGLPSFTLDEFVQALHDYVSLDIAYHVER